MFYVLIIVGMFIVIGPIEMILALILSLIFPGSIIVWGVAVLVLKGLAIMAE